MCSLAPQQTICNSLLKLFSLPGALSPGQRKCVPLGGLPRKEQGAQRLSSLCRSLALRSWACPFIALGFGLCNEGAVLAGLSCRSLPSHKTKDSHWKSCRQPSPTEMAQGGPAMSAAASRNRTTWIGNPNALPFSQAPLPRSVSFFSGAGFLPP